MDNNGTFFGAGPTALDSVDNPHTSYPSLHLDQAVYYYVDIRYATRVESTTTSSPSTMVVIAAGTLVVVVVVTNLISYFRKRKH